MQRNPDLLTIELSDAGGLLVLDAAGCWQRRTETSSLTWNGRERQALHFLPLLELEPIAFRESVESVGYPESLVLAVLRTAIQSGSSRWTLRGLYWAEVECPTELKKDILWASNNAPTQAQRHRAKRLLGAIEESLRSLRGTPNV